MKRNLFKKLAATVGAAVMALTLVMPLGVQAADTGSVTITKYTGTEDGYEDLETAFGGQQTPINADNRDTLNGVKFAYVVAGDRVQVDVPVSGDVQTEVLYTITDTSLKTALDLKDTDAVEVDSVKYYRQTTLDAKIRANKNAVINYVKTAQNKTEQATATDGTTVFSNLDLHKLYLFAETDASDATSVNTDEAVEVTKVSVPFFVALPFMNADGTEVTDIYAYPKNSTGDADITKEIATVGNTAVNDTEANAKIGDEITYKVDFSVPVPENGLAALTVVDKMDKGLTFTNAAANISVADTTASPETTLTYGTNYTVTEADGSDANAGKKIITINFANYLSKLTPNSTATFTITYKATLNENAVLGQTANRNIVELNWTNTGEVAHEPLPGNETKVFTYGIDLTKTGENATPLADVEFTLEKETATAGTYENVNVESKTSGTNTYYVTGGTAGNTVKTNAAGKISIRGLEPGTYKLTETKTNAGYVLLKDPITIVINQTNAETGVATATVNGDPVDMDNDDLNVDSATAKVPLSVVNSKGFDLPATGAAGTAAFAIAGIVIVAVAGALLVFRRKSSK